MGVTGTHLTVGAVGIGLVAALGSAAWSFL
jgi:hypothetical protein